MTFLAKELKVAYPILPPIETYPGTGVHPMVSIAARDYTIHLKYRHPFKSGFVSIPLTVSAHITKRMNQFQAAFTRSYFVPFCHTSIFV
jgi:hypothetical protein